MINIKPNETSSTYILGNWSTNPIEKIYHGIFSKEDYPLGTPTPLRFEDEIEKPEDNLPEYLEGFDIEAGKKLADTVEKNTVRVINETTNRFIKGKTKSSSDSTSNCCRFVKRALEDIALMPYQWVNACDMKAKFRADKNFGEIDLNKIKDATKLPAGCILVYDKNDGYSSEYGHIAVTLGDGRTASDLIEINPKKTPSAAFYPLAKEVKSIDIEA